jgi:hypothetical protein
MGTARGATDIRADGGWIMKRVAVYARVSTSTGQNPEMQLQEVRQYCSAGNDNCSRVRG